MIIPHFKLLATVILHIILTASFGYSFTIQDQDIHGGAILPIPRPENPLVRKKPKKTSAAVLPSGVPPPVKAPQSSLESVQNQAGEDMNDEVEDALALANSARDDKPPRYSDAERAYKLAIKLNFKDPRPYQGLGNIYFDQKKFEEAAKAYKEALSRMPASRIGGFTSGPARDSNGIPFNFTIDPRFRSYFGQVQGNLGSIYLQQGAFDKAIPPLASAAMIHHTDAQWQALLGYAHFKQKQYFEAAVNFNKAVELAPENLEYKNLQQSIIVGTPNELKGVTKVYLDTRGDTLNRQRVLKQIKKQKKQLGGLEFLERPENAEVHLVFFCQYYCKKDSEAYYSGYIIQPNDNQIRVLMDLRNRDSVNFIKDFIRAYNIANPELRN
jgi:tetratricopeptide (TPR) repeat protein